MTKSPASKMRSSNKPSEDLTKPKTKTKTKTKIVDGPEKTKVRVQKILSELGVASRREAEVWIKDGRIKINRVIATLGSQLDPKIDLLFVDNEQVNLVDNSRPKLYWLLHKPDGVLTTRKSQGKMSTIYDLESLWNMPYLLSPVGRLDFRTEGLLLLTNDGELAYKLSHPKFEVPRQYQVLLDQKLTQAQVHQIRKGIELEDGPAPAEIIFGNSMPHPRSGGKAYWYFVTVKEGRNRLIRRIFETMGAKVYRLIRTGFGDLSLPDDLPPGQYRQLTKDEIKFLKRLD